MLSVRTQMLRSRTGAKQPVSQGTVPVNNTTEMVRPSMANPEPILPAQTASTPPKLPPPSFAPAAATKGPAALSSVDVQRAPSAPSPRPPAVQMDLLAQIKQAQQKRKVQG